MMAHKQKSKDEGIFAHGPGLRIVLQGLMFAILSMDWLCGRGKRHRYAGRRPDDGVHGAVPFSDCAGVQNMRSEHSLFKIGPFTNHKHNWAALASILLVCLVLFARIGAPNKFFTSLSVRDAAYSDQISLRAESHPSFERHVALQSAHSHDC